MGQNFLVQNVDTMEKQLNIDVPDECTPPTPTPSSLQNIC